MDMTMTAGHTHAAQPQPPARNDPRFAAGSTGPTVPKGQAPTLSIPDGLGFGGLAGRKQNANDKKQNNYSVTDANFNNRLGVLATNPDTGQPMNYVQDIQTYNAAGYIETYAPKVYSKLAAAQDAGRGTILGGAAHLMGLVKTADPSEAGINPADIPSTVPGTNLNARQEVMNTKDSTGQNWARPHHAETHWDALKSMIDLGVDQAHALRFSGDNAISGAGRLNGVNNQDGASGFNAGELKVFQEAAAFQAQTGTPVILAMMQAHNHLGGDPSALTDPAINKQLGLAANDRSVTAARANAIAQGLLDGTVHNNKNTNNGAAHNNAAAGVTGGGGAAAGNGPVTGAGTGAVGTIDTVDPVAALGELATTGFADGAAGAGSQRLSLIMQSLLKRLADGTQQLTPELLAALKGILAALQASNDPKLQAIGKALEELTTNIARTGTIDQTSFLALEKVIGQLGAAAGNLDPLLAQQMGIDPTTGLAPAATAGGTPDAAGGAMAATGMAMPAASVAMTTPAAASVAPAVTTAGSGHGNDSLITRARNPPGTRRLPTMSTSWSMWSTNTLWVFWAPLKTWHVKKFPHRMLTIGSVVIFDYQSNIPEGKIQ